MNVWGTGMKKNVHRVHANTAAKNVFLKRRNKCTKGENWNSLLSRIHRRADVDNAKS